MWLLKSLLAWWGQAASPQEENNRGDHREENCRDPGGSGATDSSGLTRSLVAPDGGVVDLDEDGGASFEGWRNRPMWRAQESAIKGDGRAVDKLKGFFRLAKEELDKAMRAEESKQPEDAVAKYRSAHLILTEALSAAPGDEYLSRCVTRVRSFAGSHDVHTKKECGAGSP